MKLYIITVFHLGEPKSTHLYTGENYALTFKRYVDSQTNYGCRIVEESLGQ